MLNIFRGSFGSFFGPFFVLKLKFLGAVSFCRQAALKKPLKTSENRPSQRPCQGPSQRQISLSEALGPVAPNGVAPYTLSERGSRIIKFSGAGSCNCNPLGPRSLHRIPPHTHVVIRAKRLLEVPRVRLSIPGVKSGTNPETPWKRSQSKF